ncbi:MAG: cytochrome C oxidase subunit IV family protein [Anaerolineae bacterium]|nr:cytochrome C oxidase subunit IV family protein [Anaerolineae bacterium]
MTEYTPQLVQAEHKKPKYLLVFFALAAITLVEVTVATRMPAVLVALSLSKVVLVALYYMHLKFSSGLFSAIFAIPLPFVLLILVALVVALAPGPDNTAAAAGVCSFF